MLQLPFSHTHRARCDATRTESLAPCLSRSRPVSMCQESAVSLSLLSERPSRVSTDGYHLSSGRCCRCSEDAPRHCSSRCRKPALSSEKQMKQKSGADTIKGVLAWFQQVMPQARLRMFPLRQRCKSGAVSDEQELGSPPQISASNLRLSEQLPRAALVLSALYPHACRTAQQYPFSSKTTYHFRKHHAWFPTGTETTSPT
jgi:hypothetical protein